MANQQGSEDLLPSASSGNCFRSGFAMLCVTASLVAGSVKARAQSAPPSADSLNDRLAAVSQQVSTMQQRLDQSQAEVEALRAEIESLRAQLGMRAEPAKASPEAVSSSLQQAVDALKEQSDVLQSEIAVHEQTKLESSSKYPIKVTGMLLFSSFLNNGNVDEIDDPVLALPHKAGDTGGSFSATARQSILGLDATGPQLWNATTSADISIDFYGGLAYSDYATSAGIVRLRTAHTRIEWPHHSVIAEIDTPIISPLSPTSFLAVGEPALAWTGNLWAWAPQLISKNKASLGGAILNYDFALIDPPSAVSGASLGVRQPNASEQSRQPGYQFHTSYARPIAGHLLEIGAGGYYSRQAYTASEHVDSWAGTVDWTVPISSKAEISGEFYKGRAIGGLGGGAFKDEVPKSKEGGVEGLDATGGWAQLKFRFPGTWEANLAFGQDSASASQLYYSGENASNPYRDLARNRATTANVIFRPKTYLLFSTEFRYLQSWPVSGAANTAPIVGFAAGYLF